MYSISVKNRWWKQLSRKKFGATGDLPKVLNAGLLTSTICLDVVQSAFFIFASFVCWGALMVDSARDIGRKHIESVNGVTLAI